MLFPLPSAPSMPARPLHVLGLGQDTGDVAPGRMCLIQKAHVVAAAERFHAAFPKLDCKRIVLRSPLEPVLEELSQAVAEGLRVVVLVGGDPCFFGIGPLLAHRLGPELVVLHPGPTTIQAAAALLGVGWQDMSVVSLHGRTDHALLFARLARGRRVAVYTDERNSPDVLSRTILERGVENFAMWVFEDLGQPAQRWARYSLEEAGAKTFSPLNLVILERVREPKVRLALGLNDHAYVHEQGLITKRVVRASALAALGLLPDHVLWDLGAGCGSLGIEAGLLLPLGLVVSVEREERRALMILENVRRTNAYWVRIVHGQMPGCLAGLPDPDRIFLGGGLAGTSDQEPVGPDVLEAAWSRLKPGGRLVAAAVLLDTMNRVRAYLEQNGQGLEVSMVQASHGAPLAEGMRLAAQNPVFLVGGCKPRG